MRVTSYVAYILAYFLHRCTFSNLEMRHVAFEGNICCWHIFCNSLVNNSCSLLNFGKICALMWGLYVDYSSSGVGDIFAMWQAYYVLSIGESYSPTYLQDYTIFLKPLNNVYNKKIRFCHLMLIP